MRASSVAMAGIILLTSLMAVQPASAYRGYDIPEHCADKIHQLTGVNPNDVWPAGWNDEIPDDRLDRMCNSIDWADEYCGIGMHYGLQTPEDNWQAMACLLGFDPEGTWDGLPCTKNDLQDGSAGVEPNCATFGLWQEVNDFLDGAPDRIASEAEELQYLILSNTLFLVDETIGFGTATGDAATALAIYIATHPAPELIVSAAEQFALSMAGEAMDYADAWILFLLEVVAYVQGQV